MKVTVVVPGPDHHGVVRHATVVARLLDDAGAEVTVQRELTSRVPVRGTPPVDVVHVHFTDALFGTDITSAARAFASWRSSVDAPVVVTLHDVPGGDIDSARDTRRTAGYQHVAAHADAVVWSSPHEKVPGVTGTVVPLPVEPLALPGPLPTWADRSTVGVLGFVYPGKGHAEVIRAVAPGQRVVAIGESSSGFSSLIDDLHCLASSRDVDLVVTGWLTEGDLHAAARATTVPVAAYDTLGSSASITAWISAGRRPVTTPSPYSLWLDAADVLAVDDLDRGIAAGLANPSSTWRESLPRRTDTAARHLDVFQSCVS